MVRVCLWAARGARGRNLGPRAGHTCAEPMVDWVSTECSIILTHRFQPAFTCFHARLEGLRRSTATINVSCLKNGARLGSLLTQLTDRALYRASAHAVGGHQTFIISRG